MTEGGVTRTKRMGARFFKNPPQPHMCIQDFLRGSRYPCYINVLSWDKVATVTHHDKLPLYGGMKINPPRTEKADVEVFFVMANPEVLKNSGKNSSDPKEQSLLIDLLLDFIETVNEGIIFKRQYKILNDRDITGELKEIWMVVQNDREKAQNGSTNEDMKRPVPQYPQYQDQAQAMGQKQQQQQQHQQQQQQMKPQHNFNPVPPPHQQQSPPQPQPQPPPPPPQQYRPPPIQHHQHPIQQQMQTQPQYPKPNDELQQIIPQSPPQPPQYHSNYSINRGPIMDKCENYDYSYIRQPQNDRMYQTRPMTLPYNVTNPRAVRDRYLFRDSIVSNVMNQPPPQQQQNSVGYAPAPQYQYHHQLPRPMGPPCNNPNVHPNVNLACSIITNPGIPPVMTNPGLNSAPQMHYEHHYLSMQLPENNVYVKVHKMQQPQQPQIQLTHMPPVLQFDSDDPFYDNQANPTKNFRRMYRPPANIPPKNSINKRQTNSSPPTHINNSNWNIKDNQGAKSKSPVKLLQRDITNYDRQHPSPMVNDRINHSSNDIVIVQENSNSGEKKNVQVTDLDEDETPKEEIISDNQSRSQQQNFDDNLEGKNVELESPEDLSNNCQQTSSSNNTSRGYNSKKQNKSKIIVLKRNKSSGYNKSTGKNDGKNLKNGGGGNKFDQQIKKDDNNKLEHKNKLDNNTIKIENMNEHHQNQQLDNDKINNSSVNIIKNTLKLNPSTSDEQIDRQQVNNTSSNDGIFQVYTILKKNDITSTTTTAITSETESTSSSSSEEIVNEISQLSIKDCTDASEISAVPS